MGARPDRASEGGYAPDSGAAGGEDVQLALRKAEVSEDRYRERERERERDCCECEGAITAHHITVALHGLVWRCVLPVTVTSLF
jgi:hypothetical protein